MPEQPILRVVTQREDCDCAVAAIATATGARFTYEDVLRVTTLVDLRDMGRKGLGYDDVSQILQILGCPAQWRDKVDLEDDFGLLWIKMKRDHHLVTLMRGLVINTDGSIWDADTYMAVNRAKPAGIFLLEDS